MLSYALTPHSTNVETDIKRRCTHDHTPQPLPCGHSFCPACVREAWSSQGEGKGRFTCPQCQEEHGEVLCDCCPPEAEKGQPPLAVKTCLRCEEGEREREGKEQGDRQRDQSSLYLGCDQPCCELM
uniref:RING-type domain-containing protein n=1 Tax=Maylandia zebra TaxID=106582 RepID=A0A3P9C1X6_9CICH